VVINKLLTMPLVQRYQIFQDKSENQEIKNLDIDIPAARHWLKQNNADILIHGHIHKPGHHIYSNGNDNWQRWVLHNWDEQAGVLLFNDHKFELMNFTATDINDNSIKITNFFN